MNTKTIRILLMLPTLLAALTINAFAAQKDYKGYPRGNAPIPGSHHISRPVIDALPEIQSGVIGK